MQPCIMPGLPANLMQKLNVGTVPCFVWVDIVGSRTSHSGMINEIEIKPNKTPRIWSNSIARNIPLTIRETTTSVK